MDQADIDLRNATYRRFVDLGRAPKAEEVAAATGVTETAVREAWRRLDEAHALVLDDAGDIRMANPFAANATPFRVRATDRAWYANCAWDALGIGAALGVDSSFETNCPDCDAPIRIKVVDGLPDDESYVFHVLVPATQWWNDIGFT
jgi:hypothetical protein